MSEPLGIAGRIARSFINSKLTPLIMVTSVLLGVASPLAMLWPIRSLMPP